MNGEGTAGQEFVLGKAIANARRQAGLTQQDLCNKANLSYSTLAKIERGAIKTPSIFTVAAIAEATGTSIEQLAGKCSPQAPQTPQKVYKQSKTGIKFVYFDVNGTMVRYFQRAFTNIATDSGTSANIIESLFWHYNDVVCRGEMGMDEFNRLLAERIGWGEISWTDYYLRNVEQIGESRDLVTWAAEHYHIGLLTNAMPGLTRQLLQNGMLPAIEYAAVIDSSEVKCIKPELEIYQKAAEAAAVEPHEILMVDDNRTNLIAAEKLGWQTLWFDDYQTQNGIERIRQELEF